MERYCYLRNVHDKMADGKTAFEKRFGKEFDGPLVPFGSLMEHVPTTAKDRSRTHQVGQTTMRGIFLGVVLLA